MPLNEYSNDQVEQIILEALNELDDLKTHLSMFPEAGQYLYIDNLEEKLKSLLV